jgi:predicted TPR repeat methyltransferase
MSLEDSGDGHVAEIMERALGLAEEALEQIARIAVEQIRRGVDSSNHVEAAERDLRSALRQLVLAQREWRAMSRASTPLGEPADAVARVTANSAGARPCDRASEAAHNLR